MPQVSLSEIHAEANRVPATIRKHLRPILIGPLAKLLRYAVADERPYISLGNYCPADGLTAPWPALAEEARPDLASAKLYAETLLLRYFQDAAGDPNSDTFAPVAGQPFQIRAENTVFKSNSARGNTYPRSTVFGEEDCAIGDVVDIQDATGTVSQRTTIRGFVGEPLAAEVGEATPHSGNSAATLADVEAQQIGGPVNLLSLLPVDPSNYDGIVSGCVWETYMIVVTRGSTGGDLTTARLRVISGSGLDNQENVIPGNPLEPFAIGTRGLQVYFTPVDESESSEWYESSPGIDADDLLEGQRWLVVVSQDFTPPTATAGGQYTGLRDAIYVVSVSRGGDFSKGLYPQITVTTTNGSDRSGPTTVSAPQVAVPVGTQGLTIRFTGNQLRKGDVYLIPALAAASGALQTLVLDQPLLPQLQNETDLSLTLYRRQKHVLIPQRSGVPGVYNYTLDDTGITIPANMQLAGRGTLLPCAEASLFLEYRQWLSGTATPQLCETETDWTTLPGQLHPQNPLKYAAYLTWTHSGGQPFYYLQVADPDNSEHWLAALELAENLPACHGLVLLTEQETILQAAAAHCGQQSRDETGHYRVLWRSASNPGQRALATQHEGQDLQVTITATVGGYRLVTFHNSGLDLLALGLRAGDQLRVNYGQNVWGDVTYEGYPIAEVLGTSTLRLQSGPVQPITVPSKAELWRSYTRQDCVDHWVELANQHDQLTRLIWPDRLLLDTHVVPSYFAAAALTGLRAGAAPNRSLTGVPLLFFDPLPTAAGYTNRQLQALVEAGVWVLTETDNGLATRRAVTCAGAGDFTHYEEMVVANLHVSHAYYLECVQALLGAMNIVPQALEALRLRLLSAIATLQQVYNPALGPQLLTAEIVSLQADPSMPGRVLVELVETLPVPLNAVEISSRILL